MLSSSRTARAASEPSVPRQASGRGRSCHRRAGAGRPRGELLEGGGAAELLEPRAVAARGPRRRRFERSPGGSQQLDHLPGRFLNHPLGLARLLGPLLGRLVAGAGGRRRRRERDRQRRAALAVGNIERDAALDQQAHHLEARLRLIDRYERDVRRLHRAMDRQAGFVIGGVGPHAQLEEADQDRQRRRRRAGGRSAAASVCAPPRAAAATSTSRRRRGWRHRPGARPAALWPAPSPASTSGAGDRPASWDRPSRRHRPVGVRRICHAASDCAIVAAVKRPGRAARLL